MYRNKFKKFGGDYIEDIIEYLKIKIEEDPYLTITVGCDSIQKSRKTVYAITIMLYNKDIRHGAHVIFFREKHKKIRDNHERLFKEAEYLHNVGEYLDKELSTFYERKDLTDGQRKKYKYHLLKCDGKYTNIEKHREEIFVSNLVLSDSDKISYRTVDLHVDFNPSEGNINKDGISQNKSNVAYKSYVPWLRGLGFRTWAKSESPAATSAADLLLKD